MRIITEREPNNAHFANLTYAESNLDTEELESMRFVLPP